MLKRSLLLFFGVYAFSFDDYVDITSNSAIISNDTVKATGNVQIVAQDYNISSNRLFYNNKKQYLLLEPYFITDTKKGVWLKGNKIEKQSDVFKLKKTILSSCDCKKPDWHIEFQRGDYNTTSKWINSYDTKLYVGDRSIFYTPYFGFPMDKSRRSGLLKPIVGYSTYEGISYAQPIYYAPKQNYDIEFVPQIRIQRGYGLYTIFRYADSPFSMINIDGGLFDEYKDYQERYNLKNQDHYGIHFGYERDHIFTNNIEKQDRISIYLASMNDVDYQNTLPKNNIVNSVDKYVESNIKYFYNTSVYYSDIWLQYYDDLSQETNDKTLQILPNIYLQKYTNNLFMKHLIYSANIEYVNKTRETGLGASITYFTLPIEYYTNIFNNYINLSFGEKLKLTNINYLNNSLYHNGSYSENIHFISLKSDLVKSYKNFTHFLTLSGSLEYANSFQEDGDLYNINNFNPDLSPFDIRKGTRNITLKLNNIIYNKNSSKLIEDNLKQSLLYDEQKQSYKQTTLENELIYYYDKGKISNRFIYDDKIDNISQSYSLIEFDNNNYKILVDHFYSKDIITLKSNESLKYDLSTKLNHIYTLGYAQEYDLTNYLTKTRELHFNIDKKCWDIDLKLSDALVASDTITDNNLRQTILYIEVNFKQLLNIKQVYKFNQKEE